MNKIKTDTVIIALAVVAAGILIFASVAIYSLVRDMSASGEIYEELREATVPNASEAPVKRETEFLDDGGRFAKTEELKQINGDYIAWIKIEGTRVDYPVVHHTDNDKYLNTSFTGEANRYGSIFLDTRCGLSGRHIIIYGHNTSDGSMFGELRNYLDADFLTEHPEIILEADGVATAYKVSAARRTNVQDPAYNLLLSEDEAFAAFKESCGLPSDAIQVLTLSTCVSGSDDDERMIVQAVKYKGE